MSMNSKWKTRSSALLSLILALAMMVFTLPAYADVPEGDGDSVPVWDGKTIDVSWYNGTDTEFHISTPEQLAGLAAIVNGIYNRSITRVIGDPSVIVDHVADNQSNGSNNKASDSYHWGGDDFNGKTIYLDSDLDMGGVYDEATKTWSGPNYMPVGGQYLMIKEVSATKLSSSFNGTFDGQGHTVSNIYCERHCGNGNFGDGQSVGLIGRLGCHDNDPVEMRPDSPAVRNVAVSGYIYANRSVGGIVGKIGKTNNGAAIENCANYAEIHNTDAKGIGGICGASWNGGTVRNCYNAGSVSSTYNCPTGGICGSNEIAIQNCYSIGAISAKFDSFAMAIGTNNGGGTEIDHCFWLTGTAPGGGYHGKYNGTVTESTEDELKSAPVLEALGDAFEADTTGKNNGYPVLKGMSAIQEPGTPDDWSETDISAFVDVTSGDWFSDAVKFAAAEGLFAGTSDTTFSPGSSMTRAMFVTVLGRLSGVDAAQYPGSSFDDVAEGQWYSPYVAWASENGIVSGVGDGKFDPDGSVTREQMAVILYHYQTSRGAVASMADPERAGTFEDISTVSSWAVDAVTWAVGNGILNGSDGLIDPFGSASRAQVAQIIKNYVELV